MPPLDYELATFMEKLYEVNFPGVYRMTNYFSIDYAEFMARIKRIHSFGFRFRFLVDVSKIDLRRTYVILDDTLDADVRIPFLRSYVRLLPNLTYMAFFTPLKTNVYLFIYDILKSHGVNADAIREVYTAKYHEDNRMLLTLYRWDVESFDDLSKEEEWMKIIGRTEYYLDTLTDEEVPVYIREYKGPRVLREVYLKILKEIERNPFVPVREIAEKAGTRYKDVIKAIRAFERAGVFRGIRVCRFPWVKATDLYFIVFVETKSGREALALLKAASEFPLFTGGIISIDDSVMLTFLGNGRAYPCFEKTMYALEKEFRFKLRSIYLGLLSQSRRFTIPYIHGVEYNKYRKYWSVILQNN